MSYVTHANAPLTPEGRLKLAQLVVDGGWAQARVAERLQVSRATVSKWVTRYRAHAAATDSWTIRPAHFVRRCRQPSAPSGASSPCGSRGGGDHTASAICQRSLKSRPVSLFEK